MKLSYVLILFAISTIAESQIITEIIDPNISNTKLLWNTNDNNTIKGSPYLFKSWNTAVVSSIEGNDKEFSKLNIDLINGLPVVKHNDQIIGLKASLISTIRINTKGREEIYLKTVDRKSGEFIFPRILYKGKKYLLLLHTEKSLSKGKAQTGYESSYNPIAKALVKEKSFYYLKNGDDLIRISNKNLKSNHIEIARIAKREKINLNKEESLIQLINVLELSDFSESKN